MSANMLFTGRSLQIEQQITPLSSQIYGRNNLAFSNGIQTLFYNSAKLKANIAPSPTEWPVQKHEGSCDSHYYGQPGCSIDLGSIYCGSRPMIWPPPENFDYVPSFFGTCLFPNQANINSPYPRPLEAL
ncbi:unnamed protein product [Penicillium roqueforti FM164]|uniref:Genomic scaffold, ProqFM164S02 n=1 Tax=Penicillium roqueforti (strain FM164) TaxID=1365484 RepID=W6Q9D7_PENRF|nr:unnamed protein product [Penicillium roqueforti FM164]